MLFDNDEDDEVETLLTIDQELDTEIVTKHEEILNKSIKSIKYFMIITALSSFLYSSRTLIWIEYAKEFEDYSLDIVSWIFYIDSLLIGIVGISFSSLGDYIGFDKSITFKLLLITTGCILECIAWNFTVLYIGFLISQTATLYVTLAYIAWILPKKYATKQISLLYAFSVITYLIGPVFSGILYTIFENYRIIFICNTLIMILLLIFTIFRVYGSQKNIQETQIEIGFGLSQIIHKSDTSELFPSFVRKMDISTPPKGCDFCKEISIFEWYQIITMCIEGGIFHSIEAIIVTYYIPFCVKHYNKYYDKKTIVFLCSMQILLISISSIITNVIFAKYTNYLPKTHKWMILIFVSFLLFNVPFIIDTLFYFPFFWVYMIFYGFFGGISFVILDSLLLNVQPPRHSGKINGIKCLIHNLIRGVSLLLVGLLWNKVPNSMIYTIISCCILGTALSVCMLCVAVYIDLRQYIPSNPFFSWYKENRQ